MDNYQPDRKRSGWFFVVLGNLGGLGELGVLGEMRVLGVLGGNVRFPRFTRRAVFFVVWEI